MSFSLYLIFSLIGLHFVADFLMQSSWMAINKSKNNNALIAHVYAYTMTLGVGAILLSLGNFYNFILPWMIINGILHFITDYVTSRITSRLLKSNSFRWFFVVIGIDQCIHYACLFSTFMLIHDHIVIHVI